MAIELPLPGHQPEGVRRAIAEGHLRYTSLMQGCDCNPAFVWNDGEGWLDHDKDHCKLWRIHQAVYN